MRMWRGVWKVIRSGRVCHSSSKFSSQARGVLRPGQHRSVPARRSLCLASAGQNASSQMPGNPLSKLSPGNGSFCSLGKGPTWNCMLKKTGQCGLPALIAMWWLLGKASVRRTRSGPFLCVLTEGQGTRSKDDYSLCLCSVSQKIVKTGLQCSLLCQKVIRRQEI